MSAALNAQPNATTPTEPAPPEADAEAAFLRRTLHDLTIWCADVAYCLRNAIEAAETNDDRIRIAAAFDTAARSVRRTVMLARHAARPLRPAPAASSPARPPRPAPHLRLADTADHDTPERLDAPDALPDDRPIADQIADIRRDLEPAVAAIPVPTYAAPTAQPGNPNPPPSAAAEARRRAPDALDHPPTPDG